MSPLAQEPIVWVLALRPAKQTPDPLEKALKRIQLPLRQITLQPFDAELCRAYLEEVAHIIENEDPEGAQRIRGYLATLEQRPDGLKILQKATQGHPLYLALVADVLRVGLDLPQAFYEEVDTEERAGWAEPGHADEPMHDVVRQLLRVLFVNRSALGLLLMRLSRARLGASKAMLEQWVQEAKNDQLEPVTWDTPQFLHSLKKLSIVKVFPKRKRGFFLHDEIYFLFNRLFPPGDEERTRTYQVIKSDYDREIEALSKRLEQEEQGLWQRAWAARRRQAQVERLFYQLLENPWGSYFQYLVHANDWAKGDPVTFRLLQYHMERLRWWMRQVEGRTSPEITRFWDFWEVEHKIHEAALWVVRYRQLEKACGLLEQVNKKLPHWPHGKEGTFLWALWWLTKALCAFYEQDPSREEDALQQANRILSDGKSLEAHEPEVFSLFRALHDNYLGMRRRRQGKMEEARALLRRAVSTFRKYHSDGTAGVLINLAYLELLAYRFRTADDLLKEARRIVRRSADRKAEIRVYTVLTLRYALEQDLDRASAGAQRVLELCGEEDYPRFRGLTLLYWARAYRGRWNDYVNWGEDLEKGIRDYLVPALRRLLPKAKVAPVLQESGEAHVLELWDKPYFQQWDETLWDLRSYLQPTERADVYREIGRLYREWAWARLQLARRRGKQTEARKQIRPLYRAAANAFWRTITGTQEEAPASWWTKDDELLLQLTHYQTELGGSWFEPVAALIDFAWLEHYWQEVGHSEEEAICRLLYRIFAQIALDSPPDFSSLSLEEMSRFDQWYKGKRVQRDTRFLSQLAKTYMLHGHVHLRALRKVNTSQEKEDHLRRAVDKIAVSFELNHRAGDDSPGKRRAEAALFDWLQRHSHEPFDKGRDLLQAFLDLGRELAERAPQSRLVKFLDERYGL